jgi:meso-butanediol dehydrogenase/(S,S)-butanediol dehydrogenase/diacetyl reductase
MSSFAGKRVLVSGTGQGIGTAIAHGFASRGATVIGASLESLDLIDGALSSSSNYIHRQVDITNRESTNELLSWISVNLGPLDVLVNNAGHHPQQGPIDEQSDDSFRILLELNVIAAFALCRDALPDLRITKGSIVNIGSAAGAHGQDGSAAYCATKGALSSLTRALAIDEGPNGVRVNCVSPGAIASPATEKEHSIQAQTEIANWAALGRLGKMREVADTVVFLASEEASFITGQDIDVSGGANVGYGRRVHYSRTRQPN